MVQVLEIYSEPRYLLYSAAMPPYTSTNLSIQVQYKIYNNLGKKAMMYREPIDSHSPSTLTALLGGRIDSLFIL